MCLYAVYNHVECDTVLTTLRDDDISVSLTWFYKCLVHRFYCSQILVYHGIKRSSSLLYVSLDPAEDSYIGVSIYEKADIH